MKYIFFIAIIFTLLSCEKIQKVYDFSDERTFRVEIVKVEGNDLSDKVYPIPTLANALKVKLKVSLMDFEKKEVMPDTSNLSDTLTISVGKGSIAQKITAGGEEEIFLDRNLKVEGLFNEGVAEFEIYLVDSSGKVYITVEDEENNILGTSDKGIFFEGLTIRDIQEPREGKEMSPYYYNYIRVKKDELKNNLLVLYASGSGMYVIDMENVNINYPELDNSGACMIKRNGKMVRNPNFEGYNTVYIYSRNAPYNFVGSLDISFEFIKSGHRLNWFAGNLVEFPPSVSNGMTELSFPTWGLDDSEFYLGQELLDYRLGLIPVCELEDTDFPSSEEKIKDLEKFESNVVRVRDVVMGDFSPDDKEYKRFHQWEIFSGSKKMSVSSSSSAGEFDRIFLENDNFSGKSLASVTGILHHVYGEVWVIYPRSRCDIEIEQESIADINWNECNKKYCKHGNFDPAGNDDEICNDTDGDGVGDGQDDCPADPENNCKED